MVKLEIPCLIGLQVTRRMDVYHAGFCLSASPTPGSTALHKQILLYTDTYVKSFKTVISFYPLNFGKTNLVLSIRVNK